MIKMSLNISELFGLNIKVTIVSNLGGKIAALNSTSEYY